MTARERVLLKSAEGRVKLCVRVAGRRHGRENCQAPGIRFMPLTGVIGSGAEFRGEGPAWPDKSRPGIPASGKVLATTARQGAPLLLLNWVPSPEQLFRSGNYRSWSSAGKAGSPTSAKAITSRGLIGRDESRPKSLHPQVVPEQSPDLKPSENEEPGPVSIPECSLSLPAFPFCGYWYARNAAPHHNAGAGRVRAACE